MEKKRIFAIIGIVLPIIGGLILLFSGLMTEYPRIQTRVGIIIILILVGICLMLFQLLHYCITLIICVKEKIKTPIVLSILGLFLCIGFWITLLPSFLSGSGMDVRVNDPILIGLFAILYLPYLFVFPIVMLIRSFKK